VDLKTLGFRSSTNGPKMPSIMETTEKESWNLTNNINIFGLEAKKKSSHYLLLFYFIIYFRQYSARR
jgi:hypothetical protein